jgi:hypothetical protein
MSRTRVFDGSGIRISGDSSSVMGGKMPTISELANKINAGPTPTPIIATGIQKSNLAVREASPLPLSSHIPIDAISTIQPQKSARGQLGKKFTGHNQSL